MRKKLTSVLSLLLCFTTATAAVGCSSEPSGQTQTTTVQTQNSAPANPNGLSLSERKSRRFGSQPVPKNQTKEEELPKAPKGSVVKNGASFVMQSAEFSLRFADNNGSYSLQVSNGKTEYISAKPVILTVYANTKTEQLETEYTSVTVTDYGCLATATLSSPTEVALRWRTDIIIPQSFQKRP